MRCKCVKIIGVFLLMIIGVVLCSCDETKEERYIQTIDNTETLESLDLQNEFDYYNIIDTEECYGLMAYNYYSAEEFDEKVPVSLNSNEDVRISYSVEFSYEDMRIYLLTSIFDLEDNLIYVEECYADPVYYDDGTYDALFNIDGQEMYLSDILSQTDSCFFFTAFISTITAAKVIAALIAAAKVVAVFAGTVAVLGVTYELYNVTKEMLNEKTKEAKKEKENNDDEPEIYHVASLAGGKLIISATAVGISDAAAGMKSHKSYWTAFFSDAKDLCVKASGGYVGDEIDRDWAGNPRKGYYYHYHCLGRAYGGAHAWYGFPYGMVF